MKSIIVVCSLFLSPLVFAEKVTVEHLVILKLKEGTSTQAVDQIIAETRELKRRIPVVMDVTAGKNFTNRSKGFGIGLVVRLAKREDIEVYRKHPAHIELVEKYVKPHLEEIIVLDYGI